MLAPTTRRRVRSAQRYCLSHQLVSNPSITTTATQRNAPNPSRFGTPPSRIEIDRRGKPTRGRNTVPPTESTAPRGPPGAAAAFAGVRAGGAGMPLRGRSHRHVRSGAREPQVPVRPMHLRLLTEFPPHADFSATPQVPVRPMQCTSGWSPCKRWEPFQAEDSQLRCTTLGSDGTTLPSNPAAFGGGTPCSLVEFRSPPPPDEPMASAAECAFSTQAMS